jgi:crotonobetainyl-CoA:carnitine CoA-transferase CaiB-like acyl-CoA transferase
VLAGLRVLDLSHQYSGALCGALFADLGAEVTAIEHPGGSPIRTMLPKKDGESLWWKVVQRNKRTITLNLSAAPARDLFLRLAAEADLIVENFRPGTLEKWGIGPRDLEAAGLDLVMLRISGFGQDGPLRDLPGFGTVAEAMSGFAHLNGFSDGPPVFPSTTLADGVAGLFGAFGALAAMRAQRVEGGARRVQVVDMALFEGLFRLIPTQVSTYDQLGVVPVRPGNFLSSHGVLRNLYGTRDGRYLCVSAVGPQAMRRILAGAGAEALVARIDAGVMESPPDAVQVFLQDCDDWLTPWALARDYDALAADLAAAGAVFSRVYDVEDIVNDPHYRARGDLVEAPDSRLGPLLMQGVVPKFPGRSHPVVSAGGERGRDNEAVYADRLGLGVAEIAALARAGVI